MRWLIPAVLLLLNLPIHHSQFPAEVRLVFGSKHLMPATSAAPAPACFTVPSFTADACKTAIPNAPDVIPSEFSILTKEACPTCFGSALVRRAVDFPQLRTMIVDKLTKGGETIAFSGFTEDELLVTTVPKPSSDADPRMYYQVRVLLEERRDASRAALADASLVRLKNSGASQQRELIKDILAAQIEENILRYMLDGRS